MSVQPSPIRPLNAVEIFFLPVLLWLSKGAGRDRLDRRVRLTLARKDQQKAEREMKRQLRKEAKLYAQLLIASWTRQGETHVERHGNVPMDPDMRPRNRRKRRVQKVKFERIHASVDAIHYKILTRQRRLFGAKNTLPFRVMVNDLVDDDALFELSITCERLVTARYDNPEYGAWVIVWRNSGVGGLPTQVYFKDLLSSYNLNDPAPLVFGIIQHRDVYIKSLTTHYHLLIAGSTGTGKSNMLNCLICGLIRFVSADDLKFILVDRKLLEFSLYKDLPHLYGPVVSETDETIKVLEDLNAELRRRVKLMAGGAKELSTWNARNPDQRMPRLVLVIDEFADFTVVEDKKIADKIINLVARLVNLGRAAGIHVIVCTQYPAVEALPNKAKVNMPIVIAGGTQNPVQSNTILGNGDAAALPDIPGRMIIRAGRKQYELQTPYISEEDVRESVSIAKARALHLLHLEGIDPVIEPDGLLQFIVEKLDGNLGLDRLTKELADFAITRKMLSNFLRDVTARAEFTIGGKEYVMQHKANTYRLLARPPAEYFAEPDWVREIVPELAKELPICNTETKLEEDAETNEIERAVEAEPVVEGAEPEPAAAWGIADHRKINELVLARRNGRNHEL